jgi:hypothetical protein
VLVPWQSLRPQRQPTLEHSHPFLISGEGAAGARHRGHIDTQRILLDGIALGGRLKMSQANFPRGSHTPALKHGARDVW